MMGGYNFIGLRLGEGIFIVDGLRTPIGKYGGRLREVSPVDLAAMTVRELLKRNDLSSPKDVDFMIYGHVIRAGTGMLSARQVALKSGLSCGAVNVDLVCASGMASVIGASTLIERGLVNFVISGGMESMSRAPFLLSPDVRWGIKSPEIMNSLVVDGIYDPSYRKMMGIIADEVAKSHGIKREELDMVGYESHERAIRAWQSDAFSEYVVPVEGLKRDECIRWDNSLEKIQGLKPAFGKEGLHTAATSSQLSDGAASLLIASGDALEEFGIEAKARIVGWSYVWTDPSQFPYAPVDAVRNLVELLGWKVDDVDFFENHEAFAVNTVLFIKNLKVSPDKLNVHGGAISLGHPLGMSGARIIIELLNVLEKRGGKKGVASICHGLGGATALGVELTK